MKTGTFTRCKNHSRLQVCFHAADQRGARELSTGKIHPRREPPVSELHKKRLLKQGKKKGTTCRRCNTVKLIHPLFSQLLRGHVTCVEEDSPRLWECTAPNIQYTSNSGILYIQTYIKIYTHTLHNLPCTLHTRMLELHQ